MNRSDPRRVSPLGEVSVVSSLLLLLCWGIVGNGIANAADGDQQVSRLTEPLRLLQRYCFDCHGEGASEGNVSLDLFLSNELHTIDDAGSREEALRPIDERQPPGPQGRLRRDLAWKVLKNLRSGVMPPAEADEPTEAEKQILADWIKFGVFGLDSRQPDPGPLTIRRLNRVEYGNTIEDLFGVKVDVQRLIPADDSGHGFDNVGDALSFSPLLMEKYLEVARTVVGQAVPKRTWEYPSQAFRGTDFLTTEDAAAARQLSGKEAHQLRRPFQLPEDGTYLIDAHWMVDGSFDFDPARYRLNIRLDGELLVNEQYGWEQDLPIRSQWKRKLDHGSHEFALELIPVKREQETKPAGRSTAVKFELVEIKVRGPIDGDRRVHPDGYERYFTRESPPPSAAERREYASEVLSRFAELAFRRPPGQPTVDRLVGVAEAASRQPGATFESGVGQAMVAVLASPRFLFHLESSPDSGQEAQSEPAKRQPGRLHSRQAGSVPIDEFGLASRLSYLLWSTMPDEELRTLAREKRLREQLPQQLERMLADPRSGAFFDNFIGQWLRLRDVAQMSYDPLVVLGVKEEYSSLREHFRSASRWRVSRDELPEEEKEQYDRYRELRGYYDRFGNGLKRAFHDETMQYVRYVFQKDRELLELLDSDYAFLNEQLAEHYGIEGIRGSKLRRVELPSGSERGGVLTQGAILLVTSNPTRTSPVKRGLFVLENFLGTPAPPAPPGVPELEEAGDEDADQKLTLRELLSKHRESSICASCHARMDPIGLALENFNALGMWRTDEAGQPIDPSGELITGESFADARELKRVLSDHRLTDFYRCVTEKMMTYAIGRGILPSDEHSIDLIVNDLQSNGGRFSVLLEGIVYSAPFQSQRVSDEPASGLD